MVESIEELREICQKSYKKEQKIDIIFYRNASIYITKFLLTILPAITPNQVTSLSIILGVIGVVLIALHNPYFNLLGFLLIYAWLLLDRADGEIARYKNAQSLKGIYLDELGHIIVTPAIFMSVAFRVYLEIDSTLIFLAGFLAAISFVLTRLEIKMPFLIFSQKAITSPKFLRDKHKHIQGNEISMGGKARFGVVSFLIRMIYKDIMKLILFSLAYLGDSYGILKSIFDVNYKLVILSLYAVSLVSILIWRINTTCKGDRFSKRVDRVYYKVKGAMLD